MSAMDSPSPSLKESLKFCCLFGNLINAATYSLEVVFFYNRLSEQLVCVFSVDNLITHRTLASHLYFIVISKTLLARICQRPRTNAIAPRDQFQRIHISAELKR